MNQERLLQVLLAPQISENATYLADKHEQVQLKEAVIEEKSWRYYTNRAGVATSLRPDMYAVTTRGQLEHHWFIEVDCNTEAPVRIPCLS